MTHGLDGFILQKDEPVKLYILDSLLCLFEKSLRM